MYSFPSILVISSDPALHPAMRRRFKETHFTVHPEDVGPTQRTRLPDGLTALRSALSAEGQNTRSLANINHAQLGELQYPENYGGLAALVITPLPLQHGPTVVGTISRLWKSSQFSGLIFYVAQLPALHQPEAPRYFSETHLISAQDTEAPNNSNARGVHYLNPKRTAEQMAEIVSTALSHPPEPLAQRLQAYAAQQRT